MHDFKTRLINELNLLTEKVTKLTAFIEDDKFSNLNEKQQSLLEVQLSLMIGYSNILELRLSEPE